MSHVLQHCNACNSSLAAAATLALPTQGPLLLVPCRPAAKHQGARSTTSILQQARASGTTLAMSTSGWPQMAPCIYQMPIQLLCLVYSRSAWGVLDF
jgi:hypothetical protein